MGDEKKQLGRILLKQKLVTQGELDALLEDQKGLPGHRLASVAARQGKVRGEDLLKALSEQLGLPGIDVAQVVVPLENLELIPHEIARQHLILPILVKDDRIFLAMADPTDRRVIDEIEFVAGRRVFPYVALHDALLDTIDEAYRLAERGEKHFIGSNVPADYLASLGLTVAKRSEPPLMPQGVVAEEPSAGLMSEDELGIEAFAQKKITTAPFESQVAPLPPPPGRVSREPGRGAKILVVDDESDIRKLLTRVLTQKGYEVIEAERGLEALEKVRDDTPDLILLDAMLPEVHGFDICRRIKGSKKYGHIPVIMVSAIYRGWRVAEDLKASYGVDAFLEKPFKISDVLNHVERALAGRTSTEEEDEELGLEAGALLDAGMELYRAGDLEGAIAKLREGVAVDPLAFQLHYHLGLLCGRREDVFEAIQCLETAVDLQPRNFSALKNLAVLYQRSGFKHKATEMWERALALAPDDKTKKGIRDHLLTLL
ncbi:MAG: DNA-binding response OmpR family regulator [Polyangiales bacterium]|jgi:DNA-binding response OmpR family regulator